MNPQVPLNNTATDTIIGKAADGSTQQFGSLSITIDKYSVAYVAAYPAAGPNGFIVVPKNPSQVGTITVTVTANATDLAGDVLPPVSQAFDIVGATPPPLVTSAQLGTPNAGVFLGSFPDPGSGTVKLIP